MNRSPVRLEDLRIASPCPVSWDSMSGDERVRHCRECGLNVYDLSRMTRAEAERLVATTEGRLCGRLFKRADGTVLTADCPVGWRAVKRRTARAAGAALTVMLSLFTSALGQAHTAQRKQKADECHNQLSIRRERADPLALEKRAPLSGTILDQTGAVVAGVTVTLTETQTGKKYEAASDDKGHYAFALLPAGSYKLAVSMPGFKELSVPNLALAQDETLVAEVTLEAGVSVESVFVGIMSIPFDEPLRERVMIIDGVKIRYED